MEIKMYDKIKLKDGREATIVEIYEQGKVYEADILVDDTGEYAEYETDTIKHEDIEKVGKINMKIITGISKEKMLQISNEATKKIPSKYCFKINIDNKEYEAILHCYVIYDEKTVRNPITGILEYNKKTINRIEVYNFSDIEKIREMQKQNQIFKIDDNDYYLGESEEWIIQSNKLIFIAVNTNNF